ncbi:MAG: ACT domain-containing protein [bacterium]|nr:ACT domain-containing protein [bacterium]
MEKNTAEITNEYVNNHPYVKNCLKKGLINYSALARHIAKELKIEKQSSKEAILIASRRIHEKLRKEFAQEKDVLTLLLKSEIEIKTKISVFIVEKSIDYDLFQIIQTQIKKELGFSYLIEGSANYTIITQEKFSKLIQKELQSYILKSNKNLVLINIKTSEEIENILGVSAYLTSLFAENGVNIYEIISCWTDTIFIIDYKNLNKSIDFLKFE